MDKIFLDQHPSKLRTVLVDQKAVLLLYLHLGLFYLAQ
jgi:hypothetical protein